MLQVGSFFVAAAAKKLLNPDPAPNFKALSPNGGLSNWLSRYPPSQSRGVITYHPWYHQFRPSVAMRCLAESARTRRRFHPAGYTLEGSRSRGTTCR